MIQQETSVRLPRLQVRLVLAQELGSSAQDAAQWLEQHVNRHIDPVHPFSPLDPPRLSVRSLAAARLHVSLPAPLRLFRVWLRYCRCGTAFGWW